MITRQERARLTAVSAQTLLELPLLVAEDVQSVTPYQGESAPPTLITPSWLGRSLRQVGTKAQNFEWEQLRALGVTRTAVRNARKAAASRQSE